MALRDYIICHAPSPTLALPLGDAQTFRRIQTGAAVNAPLPGLMRDDSGQNISARHGRFAELSAMYWVWKNVRDLEYVGFSSYRRYLFLQPGSEHFGRDAFVMAPSAENMRAITSPAFKDVARAMLSVADLVALRPMTFHDSIARQFVRKHGAPAWQTFLDAIRERLPEYEPALGFFDVAASLRTTGFVARWDVFDHYMGDLFDVLLACEERLEPPADPYQARVLSFLSERFFNLFLFHHRVSLVEVPSVALDVSAPDGSSSALPTQRKTER